MRGPLGVNLQRPIAEPMMRLTYIVLVAGLTACAGQSGSPDHRRAAVAAIDSAQQAVLQALRNGDIEAYVNVFDDSATVMPPGAEPVRGQAAIRAWAEPLLRDFSVDVQVTRHELIVDRDWAFDRHSYVLRLTPRSGGRITEDRGNAVVVSKRQSNGSWKGYIDIWNSGTPSVS
jgi:ketosteroid isomerase-like protein